MAKTLVNQHVLQHYFKVHFYFYFLARMCQTMLYSLSYLSTIVTETNKKLRCSYDLVTRRIIFLYNPGEISMASVLNVNF